MNLIRVTVHTDTDETPDLSYLDQTDAEMGPGFEAESAERRRAYEAGDWEMVGVYVTAHLLSDYGVTHTLRSMGLWGIESDSGDEYLHDVAVEEMLAIVTDLRALGITDDQIAAAIPPTFHADIIGPTPLVP